MKTVIIIIAMLMLSACTDGPRPVVGAPWKQKMMLEGPPNSPPKFSEGWRDGCETSIAANANHLQKFFYKFKQNSELAQNPVYYAGWKSAREYCQKYVFNYLHTELIGGEAGGGLSLWGSTSFFGGKNE